CRTANIFEFKIFWSNFSWGMESNLVAEFIAQTGAETTVAYRYLQAKNWDIKLALQAYFYRTEENHLQWSVPEENGNVADTHNHHAMCARPVLQKTEAVDVCELKKLTRGISRATENINLVSQARSDIALDFWENTVCNVNQYFIETPMCTFMLPDLTVFPEDFRGFLEKDLIEMSSLISLEQAGRLNWWADSGACQRLWPLATTGDGNCLLHAASLGLWGFHDRLLTLRKALHEFLTNSNCRDALYRRWRWQQTRVNAEAGFVYSEAEWLKEWDSIVNMASSEPRKPEGVRRRSILSDKNSDDMIENATYESLEEVHVLALAHVLRRPIVVIADLMLKDVNGEDLAPIPFGGIYLPLECSPADCRRSPLILTYDAAHFSALVVMEKEDASERMAQAPAVIPLTNSDHELLPIQFSVDPGEQFVWGRDELVPHLVQKLTLAPSDQLGLLREYLDVINVSIPATPGVDEGDVYYDGNASLPANDEDEIDKRFCEILDTESNDENGHSLEAGLFGGNRSKAAKQLQSVAKQFGSIGKSMSKKLKKNLGSITKMTRSNSQKKSNGMTSSPVRQTTRLNNHLVSRSQDFILCAVLHTEKRPEYQEEMVRNYLQSARVRFQRDKLMKQKQAEERRQKDEMKLKEIAQLEGQSLCINPGCDQSGSAVTSYMCKACFEKQRDQELSANINSPVMSRATGMNNNSSLDEQLAPRYGTGKSRFYTESDSQSHNVISRLPASKAGINVDQTLYLSKSTFYNDLACLTNPVDSQSSSRQNKENMRTEQAAPMSYRHSYSPTTSGSLLWQDEHVSNRAGGKLSVLQEAPVSRIHSYNLARSRDSNRVTDSWPLAPIPGKTDVSSNSVFTIQSADSIQRCSANPVAARNIAVTSLSPLPGNELPNVERVNADSHVPSAAKPCRTSTCKFYGNSECENYCSKCYKDLMQIGVKSLQVQEVKR
ncbi:OTU domain-containing protein 7B, partial [Anabrus simplex]|uniref:OTU domain-containing protein 7B n=1 Tax=Anabrus simplex TaxID=316456 RepID=UPI0035A388B7